MTILLDGMTLMALITIAIGMPMEITVRLMVIFLPTLSLEGQQLTRHGKLLTHFYLFCQET
jgi:hypothetical protein